MKGELKINLDGILDTLNNTNVTKLSIPIESTLQSIFNTTSNIPLAFRNNFTVIDGFDDSYGKFGNSIGNVALIDCKYIKRLFHNTWLLAYEELIISSPYVVLFSAGFDRQIRQQIDRINFCDYAMNINGKLKEQIDVYTGTRKNIRV